MNDEMMPTEDMECTPESPDCKDAMCKMCAKKIWNGSAFEGKM